MVAKKPLVKGTGLGNPVEYHVSSQTSFRAHLRCFQGASRPTRGPGAVYDTHDIVLSIGIGCCEWVLTQSALVTEHGLQTGHLENLQAGTKCLDFQRPRLSSLAEEELVTPRFL